MSNITISTIKKLNPCQDRIDDFEAQYPEFNDSLEVLLSLENVSYSDKIWLATKVLDIKILQQWSVNCAEFVVDNFNKKVPYDSRISDCIDTTKRYLIGDCSIEELSVAQSAAESAALSAALSASAWSTAWSAAQSAAWSSASAWSAAESAAWSAQAAESAAWSAVDSASAWSAIRSAVLESGREQEDINLSLLIALL